MRNPEFKIDLSLYQEAMNLSLHDEVWFHNALRNRENLREITKSLTKEDCDIAVNRFTANKDIGEFLKFKKNEVVDEDTLNILLNTSSKESKSKIIQLISKKTENHAAIVSALLNEYCQQTRDIFDAKILAFLENIEEAFAPIKKFKIELNESKFFLVMLDDKGITTTEEHQSINEYFSQRAKSNKICRGYVSKNMVPEKYIENAINKLLYVKECKLPVHFVQKNFGDYKIVYKENQVCHMGEYDFTISCNDIKILNISKVRGDK
jgi:hypothetical protein